MTPRHRGGGSLRVLGSGGSSFGVAPTAGRACARQADPSALSVQLGISRPVMTVPAAARWWLCSVSWWAVNGRMGRNGKKCQVARIDAVPCPALVVHLAVRWHRAHVRNFPSDAMNKRAGGPNPGVTVSIGTHLPTLIRRGVVVEDAPVDLWVAWHYRVVREPYHTLTLAHNYWRGCATEGVL